jgi:cation-transporting ATPase I
MTGEPDVRRLLEAISGARAVRANPLTGNVLVQFDERVTDARRVARELEQLAPQPRAGTPPALAETAVRKPPLRPAPGVSSPSRPPVDVPPSLELVERFARAIGACIGLGFVAARGRQAPPLPASRGASAVAAAVSVLDGSPELRALSRRVFGEQRRTMLLGLTGIVAHTVSGSPLGLAVAALVSMRQVSESLERRRALDAYSIRSSAKAPAETGWIATLDDGDRLPLRGRILRGTGVAIARDGLPRPVRPGAKVGAGARLFGGPFVAKLRQAPLVRPERGFVDEDTSYLVWMDAAAFVAGAVTFLATRSVSRAVGVLVLLSPRPAVLGREAADAGANLRALRSGALPVRADAVLRRPDIVLVGSPRVLSDGLELESSMLLDPRLAAEEAVDLALSVAALAGRPWGPIRAPGRRFEEGEGSFDGEAAHATIDGLTYTLRPDPAASNTADGAFSLVLWGGVDRLAVLTLKPRLARNAGPFADACRRLHIEMALVHDQGATRAARELARKAGLNLLGGGLAGAVRRAASGGRRVAVITDAADEAEALAQASLSIGLAAGLSEPFDPAVDVLAPDLASVTAVLEAAARREAALNDARLLALVANALGSARIARGAPDHRAAATLPNLATVAGLVIAWLRLRGGSPPRSSIARLVDPRPERWGRRGVDDVLHALASGERGLSTDAAAARAQRFEAGSRRSAFLSAGFEQIRSPMTGILAVGAGLSLATGAAADVVLISAVIGLNALLGALQERHAGEAAAELERMGRVRARVLRDGRRVRLPASEIVPGDLLLLRPGERVTADARVIRARGLTVDEAALTGESFPVTKRVEGGSHEARIVLDGTDVTVGSGRAVAFAVGPDTRLGATAAAVGAVREDESPLGRRLHAMLLEVLPVVVGGGVLVILAGLLWRRSLAAQLALGAGTAIAAVPEGLPLLAGVGQAGVARRLATRQALVRRLNAVETLGRVDVVCVDKTGTLTENRLTLQAVVASDGTRGRPRRLSGPLRAVLRCAAIASPRAGSSSAAAHATDVAVLEGARAAGLGSGLGAGRTGETPFDAARPFHAALLDGRLCVKGSAEELVPRCTLVRRGDALCALDEAGRDDLLRLAERLAGEGLRVLMVAEGGAGETAVRDPHGLVALGFLGIGDTIRGGVSRAVNRCREAGIRMIMLTGDHPATARAIAREIGLLDGGRILTGPAIDRLPDDELADTLDGTSVVARIDPLEKLRIVEALRRRGHVVAMTGDGVNDGPALRLADVGVAMGRDGTEVARQAGDLVLGDDDFAVLVETLIEGRTFWSNLRRSLAMLLGGNLGEVTFIVLLAAAGVSSPLTARQVLAVNLVSDVLPALSLVIQSPREQDLSQLAREGDSALGAPLRAEILTRAVATATPAVAAYAMARLLLSPERAQSVGFASIVVTQLAQTLDAGRATGGVSRATAAAVAGTVAALAAALHVRPLGAFLGLTSPGILGWLLIATSGAAAPAVARAWSRTDLAGSQAGSQSDTAARDGVPRQQRGSHMSTVRGPRLLAD